MQPIIYAHEHTTIDLSAVKQDQDCKLNNIEQTIESFKTLKAKGVVGIVDVTNRGMGRDVEYIREVEEAVGMPILKSTGYYKEPFLPQEVHELSKEVLAKIMIQEIEEGIEGTRVKASIIGEIGTSKGEITPVERKIFEASCIAQQSTGVPIVTHTTLGQLALEQIEIFNTYHIDLSKVVISHMDLNEAYEVVTKVLQTGVNIGFDTIGKNNYQPDTKRCKWLKDLCDAGYAHQIVLSMDLTRKSHFSQNGGLGYEYLIDEFVPLLRQVGMKETHLEQILYLNAKRIYNF